MPFLSRHSILLLCIVCLITLGASLRNDFVWAARAMVRQHPSTRSIAAALGSFIPKRWHAATLGRIKESYRPLANVSYAIDNALCAGNPAGFHLSNLAYHVAAVCLLYWLAGRVLVDFRVPAARAGAWVAALALALHPALVEASVWIENRGVLICASLSFLTYGLFLRHLRRPRPATLAGAVVLYVFALLAQEIAVALPIVIALHLALRPDGRNRARRVAATLPLFALAGIFALLRMSVLKSGALLVNDTPAGIPFLCWALAAVRTVGGYFATLAAPIHLSPDRYFVIPQGWRSPGMPSALAGLAAWGVALAWPSRQPRLKTFALLALLAALLPVSNIVFIPGRPMADQRLYIPAAAAAFLLGAVCATAFAMRDRSRAWLIAALLVVWSCMACYRTFDFRNDYVFWRGAVRASPRKGRCKLNLGITLKALSRLSQAEAVLASLARQAPQMADAHDELGRVLVLRGDLPRAVASFAAAAAVAPAEPLYAFHAAVALFQLQQYADALGYIQRAKALPQAPAVVWALGSQIYQKLGQPALAEADDREAERRRVAREARQ